jgi:ubiquinone/menaquinone biosynthesis C-methylase UbiE
MSSAESAKVLTAAQLVCSGCEREYPIIDGVPRFVPRENYASGFGVEWTKHARTQYDSYSGLKVSEQRFFGQTHWPRNQTGEVILEVGSGSGRFTEQAANTGATVVSLDYSYAVDANYASNGMRRNVLIVQADVFTMPFRSGTFDRLFCFGMLQHTPSPVRAFGALPRVLKPGGLLCADIYKISLVRTVLQTKYWIRPFTRNMNPDRLYSNVRAWVDFMWPLARVIRRLPRGYAINWRLLVADYSFLGLEGEMLKEWSYLDTFDMLAPRYDRPATLPTFRQWADNAGLMDIEAEYTPHGVVLRASAPLQSTVLA